MKLKSTVFDSELEANTFHALELRWLPSFKVFPSLPLLKIFQVDSDELTTKELWYFQKSNLDYTICLPNNQPILSIEFDGVKGAYSRDGVYSPEHKIIDPMENHSLDLKLKAAKRANYPLMLISFEELKNFDEEDTLTILNGVIRQLIAQEELPQCSKGTVEEHNQEAGERHNWERYEDVQDQRATAQNETELSMNPIADKAIVYEQRCAEFGIIKHRFDYLIEPPLFGIKNIFDEEIIQSKIKAMKEIVRVGCRVMVENSKVVTAQPVWIHNSDFFEINLLLLAKNIAKYLALKRIHSLLMYRFKDSSIKPSPS